MIAADNINAILCKVLAVTERKTRHTYSYHVDGQLATATEHQAGKAKAGRAVSPLTAETEEFLWDGLTLVKRGGVSYVNEPHPGGGAAVLSSKDGVMFNDILGTTLGVEGEGGYTATPLTAFGDALPSLGGSQSLATASPQHLNPSTSQPLFTGKPLVDGLGHAFLMRNYRAGLGKWLTADPLGYPDGWNQLAYCGNGVMSAVDYIGGATEPMPGYENIPNEILDGTANGGTVSYKLAGFDTQSKFDHTEITGWFYVGIELWAICVDYDRQKVWKILDVEMTFSTPTLLSKLAGKTGTVGELGGWLSAFLSRIPGIGFASTIASAIGKLEDDFADEVSEYLGQVRQLVSNELIAVRMYSKRIE